MVDVVVADRLTKLGAWLRATSLDELPELFNVVRGDMSPGLTGLAQVQGRNDETMRFLCAVGYPGTRTRLVARGDAIAVTWQHVWISPMVVIGDHAQVSYGATVGHDTVLGRCSSIMPGAALADVQSSAASTAREPAGCVGRGRAHRGATRRPASSLCTE